MDADHNLLRPKTPDYFIITMVTHPQYINVKDNISSSKHAQTLLPGLAVMDWYRWLDWCANQHHNKR